jgi:hypothetical protein
MKTGEDEIKLIMAHPREHHPDWADDFFQVWEPLFKVNLFTDKDKAAWADALDLQKQWNAMFISFQHPRLYPQNSNKANEVCVAFKNPKFLSSVINMICLPYILTTLKGNIKDQPFAA